MTEDMVSPGLLSGIRIRVSDDTVLELLLESQRSAKAVPERKSKNAKNAAFISMIPLACLRIFGFFRFVFFFWQITVMRRFQIFL